MTFGGQQRCIAHEKQSTTEPNKDAGLLAHFRLVGALQYGTARGDYADEKGKMNPLPAPNLTGLLRLIADWIVDDYAAEIEQTKSCNDQDGVDRADDLRKPCHLSHDPPP